MDDKQEKQITNEEEKKENPNQETKIEQQNQEQKKDIEGPKEETKQQTSMVEVKKKKIAKKGSYILGTIGALLGGGVAALPWLVRYIFARESFWITIICTLFTIGLPLGTFLGYKSFRGKNGKPLPIIIATVSLLIIILVTTLICPSILILKANYQINWENLKGIYTSEARLINRKAIAEDLLIGLAFTIIGIIIVKIFLINKNISKEQKQEEKRKLDEEKKAKLREQSKIIKNACIDLKCTSKETAIKKKEILKQLKIAYDVKRQKAKLYFVNCKTNKLLKKHRGKYYYDETDEQEKIEEVRKIKTRFIFKKIMIILILIALLIGSAVYLYQAREEEKNQETKANTLADTNIEIEIDENTQDFYGTYEAIANAFGEAAAAELDFVLIDKANKYELNGKAVPKAQFVQQDMGVIIQEDRDGYAILIGEEFMSEITDKQFGNQTLKSYNYTYTGTNGNLYKSVVYLCEAENHYIWIGVYADYDVELTQIDTIIDNLLK